MAHDVAAILGLAINVTDRPARCTPQRTRCTTSQIGSNPRPACLPGGTTTSLTDAASRSTPHVGVRTCPRSRIFRMGHGLAVSTH